jgi:hypothetical protein
MGGCVDEPYEKLAPSLATRLGRQATMHPAQILALLAFAQKAVADALKIL